MLPDGEGRVLAAVCDPPLINRVGEGKGAMHTPPIHYLIRIAHSERWSPSLYLNGKGLNLTQCEAPNQTFFFYFTDGPSTCLCAPLRIKSHRFNQQMSALSGEKKNPAPVCERFRAASGDSCRSPGAQPLPQLSVHKCNVGSATE